MFRRRRKGKEAQVRLLAALGHAAEQLLHVFAAFLGRTLPGFFPQFLAAQHFLEIGCGLAALGTVGFVDDDGATPGGERPRARRSAFLGHLEQLARDEREFLHRGDDHRNGVLEGLGELSRAFVDPLHDAALVFELIDGVLKLLVEHDAIGDHDHAVKDPLVGRIVQGSEPMRQPTDGVALAAARRMFDEVVVPHALAAGGVHQHAHRLELVVAGEDHGLRLDLAALIVAFLVDLQVDETGEEVEQAVALQHLFPQVCRSVGPARWIGRVSGCSGGTLVEGKKARGRARQTGGHKHGLGVHGKVHQRAVLEFEDRLVRVAILPILPARILDPLARERVLQFHRSHRDAVQAQRHIEGFFRARRVMELPGQSQPIRGVAGFEFRIQLVRRLEVRRMERSPIALEPVSQRRERTVGIHPLAQVAEHLLAGLVSVQDLQLGPLLGLGLADEGQNRLGENRALAVEALAGDGNVSVLEQMRFDDGFEGGFGSALHGTGLEMRISHGDFASRGTSKTERLRNGALPGVERDE